jgi:exodeoxyribonuclease-3
MKLLSWNVNGLRASIKKGFHETLNTLNPDILCLQETKALPEQLEADVLMHPVYKTYWNSAERKGYSGVAVFTKEEPLSISTDLGVEKFNVEGRYQKLTYPNFTLYNIYFPNGGMGPHRLEYKLEFYDHVFEEFNKERDAGNNVIITGDFNVAHEEIDLARPKENQETSGFLPVEREWMTKLLAHGYIDTFRKKYPEAKDAYSWWNMRMRARERNVGWRIDYFVVSEKFFPEVKDAFILPDVLGSDHCPVGITL